MNDDRTLSELRKDVAAAALMLLAVLIGTAIGMALMGAGS